MAAARSGGTCDVALQLSGSGAQQRGGAAGLLDRAHAMSRVGEAVQSGGSRRLGAGQAVDALQRVVVDTGFQPETSTEGEMTSLRLRHCPFREVATRHPGVVCGVHLGLMQGVLDELGGAVVAESLA